MQVFDDFSDNARVWLYQTHRPMSENEQKEITAEINSFVREWAAHGSKLLANGAILNKHFIAFTVEDEKTLPSGCSIDASVKFLKAIGQKYNLDFFNRLNVFVEIDGEIKKCVYSQLDQLDDDTLVYDSLITKLGDLRNDWPSKLKESNLVQ